jgi:hypothetical protein
MDLLRILAVLIEYPILALTPAVIFAYCYYVSKAPITLGAAAAWVAYAVYEYGMSYRVLCTGECNIRVDLLLLYPMLVGLSLASVAAFILSRREGA